MLERVLLRKYAHAQLIERRGREGSQRLLFYLHELGLKVPDDISVCGWLTDYDKFCIPPITGVEQNFPVMAKHAVVTLNKMLNHESVAEDIVIDYNIFIHQSTGPAKEE